MIDDPTPTWLYVLLALGVLFVIISVVLFVAAPAGATDTPQVPWYLYRALYEGRPDLPKPRARNLARWVAAYSARYEEDPRVVLSLMYTESRFRNRQSALCVEHAPDGECLRREQSYGYFQIRLRTFREACGYSTTPERLLYSVKEQIRCGIKYLSDLQDRHDGLLSALGAYNAGSHGGPHNLRYVTRVGTAYETLFGFCDGTWWRNPCREEAHGSR